eukprot:CAMPEP_0171315334 /NCGR_PEP_ID=MMETSP0816-20121228/62721_1 /TAXON_ID=420281 /ORGANISM="Proboscia inermis, Strain CCAP1064/1" /LENGTH=420 /DNA_ID=CAMNT_0011805725 /DNA_START=53 /DNA_END=1312 /DNA_ORIENTATION=-
MTRTSKKKKKTRNNRLSTNQQQQSQDVEPHVLSSKRNDVSNFVSSAGPGCYIARLIANENNELSLPDWMIGMESGIDASDYDMDNDVDFPDLAVNPDDSTLSICNVGNSSIRVCYVTVYDLTVRGGDGTVLKSGSSTDNKGVTRLCVTFIMLIPPNTIAHVCSLELTANISLEDIYNIYVDSDVQDWNRHPDPNDTCSHPLSFPFEAIGDDDLRSYLCTQGVDGHLTHFFSGNLHAIDFRCDVGTPLIAVADGVVVQVGDSNTLSGVAVRNLFEWNSIMIHIDDLSQEQSSIKSSDENEVTETKSIFVEYVHIQAGSAKVAVGDVVTKGQIICNSGSVGFSPEPHLHFAAYRSCDDDAPTVQIMFQSEQLAVRCDTDYGKNSNEDNHANKGRAMNIGKPFLPRAGNYYNSAGLINVQNET